ncbi:YxeA family protein [Mammaliicoccus stepanovicii]|uniref:Putative DUF1093-containing protein n=1 Tax=Mammaliicoccus stepanovicii TaxID=643214 RepID=A0A239ZVC3_9STAP|nr:YxeA family protein [Mammaliicoccus stepanovicii]PNZ77455.1 hypothetical protein CD111_04615 [Mammaliicoccus stepanovicii]SNV74708.1 putative DUF1093-containing protein [Mammaliicoccus stepanovicii]
MKKVLFGLGILFVLFSTIIVMLFHFDEKIDRVNPFIKEQTSYARVPSHKNIEELTMKEVVELQDYKDIQSYDKNGHKSQYLLNFKGYDPTREYVQIHHKGLWVFSIKYLDKQEYDKAIKS